MKMTLTKKYFSLHSLNNDILDVYPGFWYNRLGASAMSTGTVDYLDFCQVCFSPVSVFFKMYQVTGVNLWPASYHF